MAFQALGEWLTELAWDLAEEPLVLGAPASSMLQAPVVASGESSRKRQPWSFGDEGSSGNNGNAISKRARKAPKPWHEVQKDEKCALQREVARLQALKTLHEEPAASRLASLLKQQRENEQLRHAIREQRFLLARAQSAITGYSITQRPPFEKYIHLGSIWADRVETFAELKQRLLPDAERYLNERVQDLEPTQEYSHATNFTAPNGDSCFSGFDVILLEGFSSVKQVFDAMRVFYFNMEITWTETSSELMIREGDYETGDQDVATQRFVRSTSSGTQIESSTVLISVFRKGSDGGGGSEEGDSAVLAVDFVDQDELYPYHQHERLRQDITSVLTLTAHPTKKTALANGDKGIASNDSVIMLRRYFYGRLRSSELELPPDVEHGVKCGSNFWFKTMLRTVGEIVKSSSSYSQSSMAEEHVV